MEVACPTCSRRLPASAVNIEKLVAKCDGCNAVFRFEDQLGASPRATPRRPPRPRSITVAGDVDEPARVEPGYRAIAMPARERLQMTRRWFAPSAIFLLVFAAFWDSFLVLWYSIALTTGAPLPMVVFPLLHVAVGVGITYMALTRLFNRTTIDADSRTVTVRHGPLPWAGNIEVPSDRLRELFVRIRAPRARRGAPSYVVSASVDGTATDLVRGLSDIDEARYIAHRLAEQLHVPLGAEA